jgi:RecB family endonuclease NucS
MAKTTGVPIGAEEKNNKTHSAFEVIELSDIENARIACGSAGIIPENGKNINLYSKKRIRYTSERELTDAIVENLDIMLGEPLLKIEREVSLPRKFVRAKVHARMDLYATTTMGCEYIIEVKYLRSEYNKLSELVQALSQLQFYDYLNRRLYGIYAKKVLIVNRITEYFTPYLLEHHKDVDVYVVRDECWYKLLRMK